MKFSIVALDKKKHADALMDKVEEESDKTGQLTSLLRRSCGQACGLELVKIKDVPAGDVAMVNTGATSTSAARGRGRRGGGRAGAPQPPHHYALFGGLFGALIVSCFTTHKLNKTNKVLMQSNRVLVQQVIDGERAPLGTVEAGIVSYGGGHDLQMSSISAAVVVDSPAVPVAMATQVSNPFDSHGGDFYVGRGGGTPLDDRFNSSGAGSPGGWRNEDAEGGRISPTPSMSGGGGGGGKNKKKKKKNKDMGAGGGRGGNGIVQQDAGWEDF